MALVEVNTTKGWVALTKGGFVLDGVNYGRGRDALDNVAEAVLVNPDELKAALIAEAESVLETVSSLKREIEAI